MPDDTRLAQTVEAVRRCQNGANGLTTHVSDEAVKAKLIEMGHGVTVGNDKIQARLDDADDHGLVMKGVVLTGSGLNFPYPQ